MAQGWASQSALSWSKITEANYGSSSLTPAGRFLSLQYPSGRSAHRARRMVFKVATMSVSGTFETCNGKPDVSDLQPQLREADLAGDRKMSTPDARQHATKLVRIGTKHQRSDRCTRRQRVQCVSSRCFFRSSRACASHLRVRFVRAGSCFIVPRTEARFSRNNARRLAPQLGISISPTANRGRCRAHHRSM